MQRGRWRAVCLVMLLLAGSGAAFGQYPPTAGYDPNPAGYAPTAAAGSPGTADYSAPFNADDLGGGYSGHAFTTPPQAAILPPPARWEPHSPQQVFQSPACSSVEPGECWQILPRGLLYQSYLAGPKESRVSSAWLSDPDRGMVWDVTLGGRAGLFRYGTMDGLHPQGIQLDLEGAAMVRLDPEENTDVEAADFRFGFLTTWREGPWASKAGYYHVSSHLGDEFLLRNPGHPRYNYVRDSAIAGLSFDATAALRLYCEAGYAIGNEGGALPWEFQYGAEYSSPETSCRGGPYAGINGHSREDLGWITGLNVVSGWQWRGTETQHRFRVGMQYYHGPALQYSFVGRSETLLGGGLWFDF